jgi:hypothetical protein
MQITELVNMYETTESNTREANQKYSFYKHACFLSVGLAVGSIAVYNLTNGHYNNINDASILTFIAGSLSTLYLKMTKDMYKSLLDSRTETLAKLCQLMTPEDVATVKIRRLEMENLKEEMKLSDKNFLKSNKKLKKIKP